MVKAVAIIQILFILILVGFSTYQLFQGRLDLSLGVFPLLLGYYVFITARNRRKQPPAEDKELKNILF
jgi:hypothetical protein